MQKSMIADSQTCIYSLTLKCTGGEQSLGNTNDINESHRNSFQHEKLLFTEIKARVSFCKIIVKKMLKNFVSGFFEA